ncbi:MAG: hypothetical protein C4325_03335 [Blastocatellia bacterium]
MFFLIIATTAGGFALTYLFADHKRFLWRFAAGNVIGAAIFGTALFVAAMLLGFDTLAILIALAVSLSPIAIFTSRRKKAEFKQDLNASKGRLCAPGSWSLLNFCYYGLATIILALFFGRAMYETTDGILTGASQNLGDLPFHLGIIFSFTEGANFPPMNPNFAGAKLSYPFITDLVTAAAVKIGASVRDSMLAESVLRAFALFVLIESFAFQLLNSRLAARLAPLIFFLGGGLGFWVFLTQAAATEGSIYTFLTNLPRDFTIGSDYRWGNPLTTLFITQRSLLLGMPLALIVIDYLMQWLLSHRRKRLFADFVVGALCGTLALIHLHSLFVLFVVGVVWTLLRPRQIRSALIFAIATGSIAVLELVWASIGTATKTSEFFSVHLWWESGSENPLIFWIRNTGLLIPLAIAGLFLAYRGRDSRLEKQKQSPEGLTDCNLKSLRPRKVMVEFYLPFFLLFILGNLFQFAPWEWDNIKILIYWFLGSVPFISYALSALFRMAFAAKIVASALFVTLVLSGSLDVWRTVSGQVNLKVFSRDAVEAALRIRAVTPKKALIVNAPTYNSVIVLTGRQSLMRYPGHLSSHGIDWVGREADLKAIYAGGPLARHLLRKYNVDFVLISPEERSMLQVNDRFFAEFPVSASLGDYTLYKVR